MCQNAFFPCLQEIRMRRLGERNRNMDLQADKKKTQQPEQKCIALFKILLNKKTKI